MTDFTLARFQFSVKLLSGGSLPPYKGSCLRGALGHALRGLTCGEGRPSCEGCSSIDACFYIRMFKPDKGNGKSVPAPYIIDPPALKKTEFAAGDAFTFTLTLVGWAADFINLWIESARHCGQKHGLGKDRIPFELTAVTALSENGDGAALYDGNKVANDVPVPRISFSALQQRYASLPSLERADVQLLTPLKFKDRGAVSDGLDAGLFLQTLFRRCKSLSHFYQPGDPFGNGYCPDFTKATMAEQKLKWVVLERKSINNSMAVNLGGLVGTFSLTGMDTEAAALLSLGEYIHLGKNTVYGCGKIKVKGLEG